MPLLPRNMCCNNWAGFVSQAVKCFLPPTCTAEIFEVTCKAQFIIALAAVKVEVLKATCVGDDVTRTEECNSSHWWVGDVKGWTGSVEKYSLAHHFKKQQSYCKCFSLTLFSFQLKLLILHRSMESGVLCLSPSLQQSSRIASV